MHQQNFLAVTAAAASTSQVNQQPLQQQLHQPLYHQHHPASLVAMPTSRPPDMSSLLSAAARVMAASSSTVQQQNQAESTSTNLQHRQQHQEPSASSSVTSTNPVITEGKVDSKWDTLAVTDKCEYCGYWCDKKDRMRRHIRTVHFKDKPFICIDCAASFGRKDKLKRHQETVHNKLQLKCEYCDFVCNRRDKMKLHTNTQHFNLPPPPKKPKKKKAKNEDQPSTGSHKPSTFISPATAVKQEVSTIELGGMAANAALLSQLQPQQLQAAQPQQQVSSQQPPFVQLPTHPVDFTAQATKNLSPTTQLIMYQVMNSQELMS